MGANPGPRRSSTTYYADKLSATNLSRCYEIAPPRVKRYLDAEIGYVLNCIDHDDTIVELGCGYGRVLNRLVADVRRCVGLDNSRASLEMAWRGAEASRSLDLQASDAGLSALRSRSFDAVLVIQNGISAFKISPEKLVRECIRITKLDGFVLFSSYSPKFWEHRLEWFRAQAAAGLLGEIDEDETGDGVIVCKDGFKATTYTEQDFLDLAIDLGLAATLSEVDNSSIFCPSKE